METIAECIGGSCDGVQLDPHDVDEPDDWADYIEVQDKETGSIEGYHFQFTKPTIRHGKRVYFYKHDSLV